MKLSFARKIILFAGIVLPVLLVTVYSYLHLRQIALERIYEERRSIASLSENILKEKLDRISDLALSFSTRPLVCQRIEAHNWDGAIDVVSRVPKDFPYIDRVMITDTAGTLMADVPFNSALKGKNYAQRDWYKGYVKNKQPYLSEVYVRTDPSNDVVCAYAAPIKNSNGIVRGILVLQVKISHLLKWTKDVKAGTTGFLYVVDHKGHLAVNPQYSQTDSIIDYSSVAVVQKALRGEKKVEILYNAIEKEDRLVAYEQIPAYNWVVVVAQEANAALAVNEGLRWVVIIYIACILLACCFAYFIIREMSLRRKAEEQLKKSVEEISDFKSLFESAPGLFLILLPDLIIDAVSDEYLAATMTKRNEIIGRHLFEVFPDNPDDPKADGVSNLRASLNTVLKTKAANAMAIQKYDIQRTDGKFEERYWSPLNKPVLNAKGEVVYIIHSVVDVTERIRHEQEILRATSEIKDLYDNAPCGYFSVNSEISISNINQTLLHWLGYTDKEVVGQMKFEDFLSAQSREQHLTSFKDSLKYGYVNDLEYEFKRKDGTFFPTLVNSTAVVDEDGNFVKSRSTVFDNTNRKKAEETIKLLNKELATNLNQLESVNKELESFSYSVSHDLRAPLRGIHGYTQMLKEDYGSLLDTEANRLMKNIMGNAKKMGQLIDDLLAFSRLGRKELIRTNMFMQEAVIAICEEMKREQGERVIEFKIGKLHPARADSVIMKQVWVNLISNALKYSKIKEHSVIEIGSEENGDEIIYYIKDNGAGFDMRYANKLFGVFQRLHSDKEFEGTGVGLAIVQRIVAKHGGRVWAEGKVNEGATFYFTLNKL